MLGEGLEKLTVGPQLEKHIGKITLTWKQKGRHLGVMSDDE